MRGSGCWGPLQSTASVFAEVCVFSCLTQGFAELKIIDEEGAAADLQPQVSPVELLGLPPAEISARNSVTVLSCVLRHSTSSLFGIFTGSEVLQTKSSQASVTSRYVHFCLDLNRHAFQHPNGVAD